MRQTWNESSQFFSFVTTNIIILIIAFNNDKQEKIIFIQRKGKTARVYVFLKMAHIHYNLPYDATTKN